MAQNGKIIGLIATTALLLLPGLANAAEKNIAFGDEIKLPSKAWLKLGFTKVAGKSYEICVVPNDGTDPDLFTSYITYADGTASNTYKKSTLGAGKADCVNLYNVAETGDYYFSIFAYSATNCKFWVVET